jgi:hypothetical protein
MKRFLWILVVLMTGAPAWAASDKVTVQQLKDLLVSMKQGKKTDEEVSTRIKEIELSEELTATEKSNLMFASPGPLTSEQICVLEARNSMLAPPSSDLPDLPAPDDAAQKVILDRAIGFAAKNDQLISRLTASKAVAHYGHVNEFNRWGNYGGVQQGGIVRDRGDRTIMALTSKYVDTIEINQGKEKVSGSTIDPHLRHTSPWAEDGPKPALSSIMSKAVESGNVRWLRWETINGTKTAVFSFAMNKKGSPYVVDYCCFLTSNGFAFEWGPFKKTVGLHGEFFIEPDSGTTLRDVIQAELSPTDSVEQEDTRVDYGTATVDGKTYVVPVNSYTHSEVDAAGDSQAKGVILRETFLVASYANYHTAEAAKK